MHVIANRWYAILSSFKLRSSPVAARRFGLPMVVWRSADGSVAAAVDECPHRRAKLSPGRVVDGCVECPFHGFRFDGDGACTAIPAHPERPIPKAMALRTFTVREEHDFIWLWTGPDPTPEGPIPFFDFSGFVCTGSEMEVPVATHYTRGIENQLDFTHLPFVHRTTIGRLVTEVMDVKTEVEGDRIVAWTERREECIEFRGPNIWRMQTGPQWQFLAFVPVDEKTMLYYVRAYQKLVKVPGLSWTLGRFNRLLNKFIIRQDTPVVETQPREETRLQGMGEVLVPSDGPIIAYRRWREKHRRHFGVGGEANLVSSDRLAQSGARDAS